MISSAAELKPGPVFCPVSMDMEPLTDLLEVRYLSAPSPCTDPCVIDIQNLVRCIRTLICSA